MLGTLLGSSCLVGADKGVGWKEKETGGCAHSFFFMWDSGHRVRVTAGIINILEVLEAPRAQGTAAQSLVWIFVKMGKQYQNRETCGGP